LVRAAGARRQIAITRHQHLRLHLFRPGGVDIVDLEPEQHAVAIRPDIRIADGVVMMLDLPPVQLQDQVFARDQTLIFRAAVRAAAAEEILIPPAPRFNVTDGAGGCGRMRTSALSVEPA
jgi:hypothetical protein